MWPFRWRKPKAREQLWQEAPVRLLRRKSQHQGVTAIVRTVAGESEYLEYRQVPSLDRGIFYEIALGTDAVRRRLFVPVYIWVWSPSFSSASWSARGIEFGPPEAHRRPPGYRQLVPRSFQHAA